MSKYKLDYLEPLEAESIHIYREVAAQFERPALLFSGGKDSITLVHLARKAFLPGPIPFPLVHIDTGHNFPEALAYGGCLVKVVGVTLFVGEAVTGAGAQRVFAQRLDALGQWRWGASGVRVCTIDVAQTLPRITGDGQGGTIVTWFDLRPAFFEALFAQRLDASGNRLWSSGGVLINGTDRIRTNEIATRAGGGIYLIWWCTSALVRCGALDLTGAALWTDAPVSLQSPSTVPPPVHVVADGIGGALVATEWGNQIFHRRLDSTGALGTAGTLLNSGTRPQGDVRLAGDDAGHVFVSWLDGRVAFEPDARAAAAPRR